MGEAIEIIPAQIKDFQLYTTRAEGKVTVKRSNNPIAKLICTVLRLPKAGTDLPAVTTFESVVGGERWTRIFGTRQFQTDLLIEKNADGYHLTEQFGPFRFEMNMTPSIEGVGLVPYRVTFMGLPVPLWLAPLGIGYERIVDDRYQFDVIVTLPLIGTLMTYKGWLKSVERLDERG